jgi:uncharacterized membrane protein YgcG
VRASFAFLIFLFSPNSEAVERVLDFNSSILIEKSGELVVTERIAVQAEGRQIRRGILRDFPTRYRDRAGNEVHIPFHVVRVLRDGQGEPFRVEPLSNGARIRIGNPDVMLSLGRHEYEITYRTGRQIGFFPDHDELYWNVNGNGWTFAFDQISAEVRLPTVVQMKLEAYTGRFGDRGRDYEAEVVDGKAIFRGTRALAPAEGLTIVVSFPKGIVREPTRGERVRSFLQDNRGALWGAAGIVLLVVFLWWRWWLVGRDPRQGPKFPRYEAPPGVGPAGARYVHKMGFDDRCFAAALLGLGERRVLKIKSGLNGYDLERRDKTPETWLPGEKALLSHLLPQVGMSYTISRGYDPLVGSTRKALEKDIVVYFGERLFSKNMGSFAVAVMIAAGVATLMGYNLASAEQVFAALAVMSVILALFKWLLPAYSVEGRKMEDAIVGLRQYLSIAEADELKRYQAPPQTAEEFAKFLPYAVALDVEKTWADRFAKAIGAAAVAAAVSDYYSSDRGLFDGSGVGSLAHSLSGLGETVSSAATAPGSSSGSSDGGGGGSSGGGGGGGGGSGW